MKITFILSSLWLSGGVRVIIEVANRLTKRGHKICFVVSGGTVDQGILKEINPDIEIREVKVSGVSKMTALQMMRLSWALSLAVPRCDIVLSTQSPTTVAVFIATVLLRRGKPVWFYQDYREMFLDRPIIEFLLKNALRWHECAMVVSEYSKQELLKYVPGKKVYVTGEGLSHMEFFRPYPMEERLLYKQSQKTILFVGDMRPRKGWNDFFSAMNYVYHKYPDIILWIISKEKCEIQTKIPFKYIHRPTRREQAHLYSICDVFVSASWWESFGLPPLEAMACGAPVVMTDTRGCREYANQGENCLMVPPRTPEALAEAVLRVLSDPDLEERIRKNGPGTAAKFKWEPSIDRFEKVLLELCS